jgi:hypothetical protein
MRHSLAAILLASTLASAGCSIDSAFTGLDSARFPYGASKDRHNFLSTEHRPIDLMLIDTVTGEQVWELSVPVGRMAIVDLDHKEDWNTSLYGSAPAFRIRWQIMDPGALIAYLDEKQELDGHPVVLKMQIRERTTVASGPRAEPPRPSAVGAPVVQPQPTETVAPARPQVERRPEEIEPAPSGAWRRAPGRNLRPMLRDDGEPAPRPRTRPRPQPPTTQPADAPEESEAAEEADDGDNGADNGEGVGEGDVPTDLDLDAPEPVEPETGPRQ